MPAEANCMHLRNLHHPPSFLTGIQSIWLQKMHQKNLCWHNAQPIHPTDASTIFFYDCILAWTAYFGRSKRTHYLVQTYACMALISALKGLRKSHQWISGVGILGGSTCCNFILNYLSTDLWILNCTYDMIWSQTHVFCFNVMLQQCDTTFVHLAECKPSCIVYLRLPGFKTNANFIQKTSWIQS